MSWTLPGLETLVNETKALGGDPRMSASELAAVLFAFQEGLTLSGGGGGGLVVGGTKGPGKIPKVQPDDSVVWADDETADPGSAGTLDAVLAAGNTTDKGIIFNETLTAPTEGNTVSMRWFNFDNLIKTTGETTFERVPFGWWQSATQQYGEMNETMHIGWNMGPASSPVVANRPAIGIAIESNYNEGERLVEMHDIYVTPTGEQIRMQSYTVRTASQVIDDYRTVSRFYLKRPFATDKVYFSVQSSASSGNMAFGWDFNANKNIIFEVDDTSGLSITAGSITVKEMTALNFTSWKLPGITCSGDSDSSNIKIKGTADAVVDLETDNLCDLGVSSRKFRTIYNYQSALRSKAGDLTTSDLPLNTWQVSKNTSSGAVKLYVNDAGSIKSVTLS